MALNRPTTNKGYDLMHVSSAFQKAIRRNEEDTAMYFLVELIESGFDEYAWKRMRIISSEDIGLGTPGISTEIYALYQMYQELKKKKDEKHRPQLLFIVHACILLCRAQKSRYIDWALVHYFDTHADEKREIPDYAYDIHNQKGRKMGRGLEWFWKESSIIHPQAAVPGEKAMKELSFKSRQKKLAKKNEVAVDPDAEDEDPAPGTAPELF